VPYKLPDGVSLAPRYNVAKITPGQLNLVYKTLFNPLHKDHQLWVKGTGPHKVSAEDMKAFRHAVDQYAVSKEFTAVANKKCHDILGYERWALAKDILSRMRVRDAPPHAIQRGQAFSPPRPSLSPSQVAFNPGCVPTATAVPTTGPTTGPTAVDRGPSYPPPPPVANAAAPYLVESQAASAEAARTDIQDAKYPPVYRAEVVQAIRDKCGGQPTEELLQKCLSGNEMAAMLKLRVPARVSKKHMAFRLMLWCTNKVAPAPPQSVYAGVSYQKERAKPWTARYSPKGTRTRGAHHHDNVVGRFASEEEAAVAVSAAAAADSRPHFSKYQGVKWQSAHNKWVACTTIPVRGSSCGTQSYLGIFDTEDDAFRAIQRAKQGDAPLKQQMKWTEELKTHFCGVYELALTEDEYAADAGVPYERLRAAMQEKVDEVGILLDGSRAIVTERHIKYLTAHCASQVEGSIKQRRANNEETLRASRAAQVRAQTARRQANMTDEDRQLQRRQESTLLEVLNFVAGNTDVDDESGSISVIFDTGLFKQRPLKVTASRQVRNHELLYPGARKYDDPVSAEIKMMEVLEAVCGGDYIGELGPRIDDSAHTQREVGAGDALPLVDCGISRLLESMKGIYSAGAACKSKQSKPVAESIAKVPEDDTPELYLACMKVSNRRLGEQHYYDVARRRCGGGKMNGDRPNSSHTTTGYVYAMGYVNPEMRRVIADLSYPCRAASLSCAQSAAAAISNRSSQQQRRQQKQQQQLATAAISGGGVHTQRESLPVTVVGTGTGSKRRRR
jgi:hypothetical protein